MKLVMNMAKRRSEIGKKGKHGREGLDVAFDKIAKRRKKTLFVVVTIIIVSVVILASLYYFFILDEEPEEEKEVLSTASPHNACYPNETALFRFTVYNPENEDDVFAPMVSGLPSDWELNLPSTIPVEGKKSIDEEFSITPSLAAQNKTYSFMLIVTSGNTQHTFSLEYELTVFELLVDVELTTEVPQKGGNPNENITFSFTIYNPNNNVDIFLPSISGLPSDWTITVPDNISVEGNNLTEQSFFIVPSPETALNKTYSFMLNVISGNTGRTYTLKYNLTVFQTFGVELLCYNNSHDADPGRSAYYAIVVKNTGNGVDTFTISYNVSNMPNNWNISFEFDSMGISGFDSKVVICNISTDSN
ncbi:MAG: hypothetical protein V3U20_03835, partial [Thermoplasmata archaeon]